ncbi:hypothetical protein [Actinocrispum wychmicini]|uniref:Uncharacterized protein n=1 Tax=Actinocrispum wychmicini TaxID=1213861 RepID=A0A4R2INI7_9PSEU|nr:hypothetical protein [Actinocrispum wychmicini]TCO44265.1 hypothetical protein EV192_12438 [Actinocrispum wychmicini]
MTLEEKRAWIMIVVSAGAYATYLVVVLGRVGGGRLADVSYVSTLLWTVGISIVASIVLSIAASATTPRDDAIKDQRDREIGRFGEYVGQSFVVIGAVAALALSMAMADYFWIANAVYLAFTLSAVVGSVARIFAYRTGLPTT